MHDDFALPIRHPRLLFRPGTFGGGVIFKLFSPAAENTDKNNIRRQRRTWEKAFPPWGGHLGVGTLIEACLYLLMMPHTQKEDTRMQRRMVQLCTVSLYTTEQCARRQCQAYPSTGGGRMMPAVTSHNDGLHFGLDVAASICEAWGHTDARFH